jgi:hypothetical protein
VHAYHSGRMGGVSEVTVVPEWVAGLAADPVPVRHVGPRDTGEALIPPAIPC